MPISACSRQAFFACVCCFRFLQWGFASCGRSGMTKRIEIKEKACLHSLCGHAFSLPNNLVVCRPAGRNKMEIHFIRRLRRPEKYSSPRKCGICAPKAHKLCAQSRRNLFCRKSICFFDSLRACLHSLCGHALFYCISRYRLTPCSASRTSLSSSTPRRCPSLTVSLPFTIVRSTGPLSPTVHRTEPGS